jgi:hypothetical protein
MEQLHSFGRVVSALFIVPPVASAHTYVYNQSNSSHPTRKHNDRRSQNMLRRKLS